jgi:hypothetical protein
MSSPPVPPPYDVRTDEIIGYGQGSSKSTIVFRDYIAPFSDGLSLTIYRDDPADNYPHSQTRPTSASMAARPSRSTTTPL